MVTQRTHGLLDPASILRSASLWAQRARGAAGSVHLVGHNGRVTPPAPAPSRGSRLRALAGRAVDDAQLFRPRLAIGSLLVLCALLLGGMLMPVPYVIESPGPAIDVLGEYEDEEILTIEGVQTYPTDGTLMMTTVSVDGGPGYTVTPVEVVVAWFDRSRMVMPRELLFPKGQTREETTLQNTVAMGSSQQGAVAVALDELDIDYEDTVLVAGVQEGAPADGTLQAGDVILAVDGTEPTDVASAQTLIGDVAGEKIPLRILRDGEELDVKVPAHVVDGARQMGILLGRGHDFPFDVNIGVGAIGGPSAGMMFSLSVYDELTPGALTGGHRIAGTGTIEEDGAVGAIGGIRQKMVGAQASEAEFFLAPAANCEEVIGFEPEGLEVVAVSTFDDALQATETIAATGTVEGLPTCEDVSS